MAAQQINIGRVGFCPRGLYDPEESYEKLDVVSYESCGYVCREDCTGEPPTNARYWQLIASGAGADLLVALRDVEIDGETLEDGQTLVWDEEKNKWTNGAGAGQDSAAVSRMINENATKNKSMAYLMWFERYMSMMNSLDNSEDEFTSNGISLTPDVNMFTGNAQIGAFQVNGYLAEPITTSFELEAWSSSTEDTKTSAMQDFKCGREYFYQACPEGGADDTYFVGVVVSYLTEAAREEFDREGYLEDPDDPSNYIIEHLVDYGEGVTFSVPEYANVYWLDGHTRYSGWSIRVYFVVDEHFAGTFEGTVMKPMFKETVFNDTSFTPPALPFHVTSLYMIYGMSMLFGRSSAAWYATGDFSKYDSSEGFSGCIPIMDYYHYPTEETVNIDNYGNSVYLRSSNKTLTELMGSIPVNPSNTENLNIWIETVD